MTESSSMLISCRDVGKLYRTGRGEVWALRGVDLDIARGEYISVMGPSGSGKSTLFNMIGALDRPSSGTISIGGVALAKLAPRQLAFFRGRHLGYIFQAYNLIPSMTALKNVALPLALAGVSSSEAHDRAEAVLTEVGLGQRLDHLPAEMSGGQQQRTAIARALVAEPTILLADEPTANLDLKTGKQIIEMIKAMSLKRGLTVISATHDHEMLKVSDRVVWIEDGRVKQVTAAADMQIEAGSMDHG